MAPNPALNAPKSSLACLRETLTGQVNQPKKFIEISYITIKRMDNTPFASMLFFGDLRIIAHLMENINHV
jgi:hypothetical protein